MKILGLVVLVSLFGLGIQQFGGGTRSYSGSSGYSGYHGGYNRVYRGGYYAYDRPLTLQEICIGALAEILVYGMIALTIYWITGCCCPVENDQRRYLEYKIKQELLHQIQRLQPSELSDEEISKQIDELIAPKWKMTVFLKSGTLYCKQFQIEAKQVDKKQLRGISIRSSDMIGHWRGEGYIGIYSCGAIFSIMKHYDNKEKAGQLGMWANLHYKGELRDDGAIAGDWFYNGFQGSDQYSGKFEMVKVQQEIAHDHAE